VLEWAQRARSKFRGLPQVQGQASLVWEMEKPSYNLVTYGTPKDEVLLYLDLMKMAELVDLVRPGDVVVGFNLKTMRTNSKLPKGDLESMHPLLKHVGGEQKGISQLQEVLCIEGHLGA
jgi:hypothetical protein